MLVPPAWLVRLANDAAAAMLPVDLLAPLGCHFAWNAADDQWEVTLFASRTEIVGGRHDGEILPSRFRLNIEALRLLFTEIATLDWHALPTGDDDLGAHLSLEGRCGEHRVWFRIPAVAPTAMPPGRRMDVRAAEIIETW